MCRLLGVAAFLFVFAYLAVPAAAEPFNTNSNVATEPPTVLAALPPAPPVERNRGAESTAIDRLLRRETAPLSAPIRLAGRCGSSNVYCSNATPYCCGTGPANYYCAKDVNGCTR